jgi:site-specific recombinase XerC
MLQLPHGCSASELSVIPKNWNDLRTITRDWRITYRFYDPSRPGPKQVNIKTMNKFKTIVERKAIVRALLTQERRILKEGYNPWLKKTIKPLEAVTAVEDSMPWISALHFAFSRLTIEAKTKGDMAHIIKVVERASIMLGFDVVEIKNLKRSHIKAVLEQCRQIMPRFSDNTFNMYRAYLRMLFSELVEADAIEFNPINDLRKKQVVAATREVLTDEQRTFINSYLQVKYPSFHRFLHIFFHSGARITELMKLQVKDVDLAKQTYTSLIIKGKRKRMAIRTIKNIALPFWLEQLKGAHPDDYVFSRGLVPGKQKIQSYQITKRWHRLVKEKFDITADFYSLKHLNTTEVVEQLGEKAAAQLNEHTSTAMVVKIYDVKRKSREHENIKKVNNPFVK